MARPGAGNGVHAAGAVVFLVAPGPLIALYTRDPQVMAVGPSLLGLAAAFQIFDGIQTVSTGALRDWARREYPCWLIWWATGARVAAGPEPVLCASLGHLRALDRPSVGPDRHCLDAASALAPRLCASGASNVTRMKLFQP